MLISIFQRIRKMIDTNCALCSHIWNWLRCFECICIESYVHVCVCVALSIPFRTIVALDALRTVLFPYVSVFSFFCVFLSCFFLSVFLKIGLHAQQRILHNANCPGWLIAICTTLICICTAYRCYLNRISLILSTEYEMKTAYKYRPQWAVSTMCWLSNNVDINFTFNQCSLMKIFHRK